MPYKKGMSYELLETTRSPQKYEHDAVSYALVVTELALLFPKKTIVHNNEWLRMN